MKFCKTFIAGLILCFSGLLRADTLGPTTLINNPGIESSSDVFSCFNSQANQYLVTFLSWNGSVNDNYFVIYDVEGNQVEGPRSFLEPEEIPSSSGIWSSYNSRDGQYLVSWPTNSGDNYFCLLNGEGMRLGPAIQVENASGVLTEGSVMSCYNSQDAQYLITWSGDDGNGYYAIYTSNGALFLGATAIPLEMSAVASQTWAMYNSKDNQYILAWTGSDAKAHFTILNSSGGVVISDTAIANGSELANTPSYGCYNSFKNQFLVVWVETDTQPYFALYAANGTNVLPSTPITTAGISANFPVTCSYNSENNQYFFTWSGSTGQCYYAVFSSSGLEVVGAAEIPNQMGFSNGFVTVFTSYSNPENQFLISWQAAGMASQEAFFALYSSSTLIAPPSRFTGIQKVNRFGVVSEKYNQLSWRPSPSPSVDSYVLQRNGVLLAVFPATTLGYQDHNRTGTDTYTLEAEASDGTPSTTVEITIRGSS